MFTGLIQTLGKIHCLGAEQLEISCDPIAAHGLLKDLAIGDSVAVNGVCLTVTKILPAGFLAAASPETLQRSTLGSTEVSTCVNLEPSLRVGSKIGGHFVTGHVDGKGCVEASVRTANAWEMSFTIADSNVARYIVFKGSIAVNGVSLTVADCDPTGNWFKVAVIPHTYTETNLQYLEPGQWVNMEGDILGKYVEKFLRLGAGPHPNQVAELAQVMPTMTTDGVTPSFLAEHGYL
ncbi:MAG: riboflavin synthase [Cyanothece sp. SIO1E1]|nr:riboflavin synthase [Cyanothece sp. SIO1E1]